MKKALILAGTVVALAACSSKPKVEVTRSAPPEIQTKSRSEPIFYNGKTYQLDYSFNDDQNHFDMKVSGLGPANKQDAVNIATSALSYYSCPDARRGRLQGTPVFNGGKWNVKAMCG